jgi:hypothetical protein
MIRIFIFRQRIQLKAWASWNHQWAQKHCSHKCEGLKYQTASWNNVQSVRINGKYWRPNCVLREFKSFSFRYCCMAGRPINLVTGGTGDKHTVTSYKLDCWQSMCIHCNRRELPWNVHLSENRENSKLWWDQYVTQCINCSKLKIVLKNRIQN